MAIRLLEPLFDFPVGTIIRDLSYDLERRLVDERSAASYDLSGGTEATVPTLSSVITDPERRFTLLEHLLLTNRDTSDLTPIAGPEMGWVDYNDLATATTPIPLTLADTFYDLTNDGLGGFTNKAYKPLGHGEIWDTALNQFDFSSLKLGDTVDIRYDVEITTSGANRDINTRLNLAIGSGSDYILPIDHHAYKAAGTYQIVRYISIYMGDDNTLNNPAKFAMSSDGTGDTVKVNGWYVRTIVR